MIKIVAVVVVGHGMLCFMLHSACNSLQVQIQHCGHHCTWGCSMDLLKKLSEAHQLLFTQAKLNGALRCRVDVCISQPSLLAQWAMRIPCCCTRTSHEETVPAAQQSLPSDLERRSPHELKSNGHTSTRGTGSASYVKVKSVHNRCDNRAFILSYACSCVDGSICCAYQQRCSQLLTTVY